MYIPVSGISGEGTVGVVALRKNSSTKQQEEEGPPKVGLMEAVFISALASQTAATLGVMDERQRARGDEYGDGASSEGGEVAIRGHRPAYVEIGNLASLVNESTTAFLSSAFLEDEQTELRAARPTRAVHQTSRPRSAMHASAPPPPPPRDTPSRGPLTLEEYEKSKMILERHLALLKEQEGRARKSVQPW